MFGKGHRGLVELFLNPFSLEPCPLAGRLYGWAEGLAWFFMAVHRVVLQEGRAASLAQRDDGGRRTHDAADDGIHTRWMGRASRSKGTRWARTCS